MGGVSQILQLNDLFVFVLSPPIITANSADDFLRKEASLFQNTRIHSIKLHKKLKEHDRFTKLFELSN